MELSESIRSLILKVHALATQGVAGERETAQITLDRLLKKYNVTIEELEGPQYAEFVFEGIPTAVYEAYKSILLQCFIKYCTLTADTSSFQHSIDGDFGRIVMHATVAEGVLLREAMEHYWAAYQKAQEDFTQAFILSNDLTISAANKAFIDAEQQKEREQYKASNPDPSGREFSREDLDAKMKELLEKLAEAKARERRIEAMRRGIEDNKFKHIKKLN